MNNNKKNRKSTYALFGIAVVAILVLAIGLVYFYNQNTKLVLSSEQTVYFPNDQITVAVSIENYKNSNEASVVVNYPENAVFVDLKTESGVTARSLDKAIVFEADNSFFDSGKNKLGTITFDSNGNGEFIFTIDKELTKLNSSKGNVEIDELINLSVSVGIASDEVKTESSTGSALNF
jgi:hypothetical protein